MSQHIGKKLFYVLMAASIITLAACGSSSSSGGGGGGDTPGTGDSATLSTNDFPTVGVCNTGSTDVTEASFTAGLGSMTAFTFLHIPYTSDADLPFICGREGTWDPSAGDAFDFPSPTPISTSDLTTNILQGFLGNVLICNDGFAFSDPTSAGLHNATTYRGELTWQDGGTTYRVRVRFTVSGTDAGKTIASLGIAATDLKLTDANGTELTTVGDVLALFAANAGSVTVNVVSGTTTHITALGRVICWEAL